jgi:hypothetical protein
MTTLAHRTILAAASLISAGCHTNVAQKDTPSFRIVATDTGFDAPESIAAGLRHIVFENRGSKIHEAMLVKLPQGMSPDDYVAEVKKGSSFPKGALDYSGPGLTSPGESAEMWLRVDPGQYLLICWNAGHAKVTPVHPFTVQYTIANDEEPKAEVVLRLADYKFEFEGNLHKGMQVIRVETPGPSMHEVDFFRLHDGKTVDDLRRWRNPENDGAGPADALGGALDSHDVSRVVWMRKNLTPGRYVLLCEMPLTPDASPAGTDLNHSDLGMVREIEIKE